MRAILPIAALAFLLPTVPRAADPTRSPSERLRRLTRVYLDGLFAAKPHLASYMGDHRFDARVQDLSPRAVTSRVRELEAQRKALGRVERDRLSPDERVDAAVLADGIALELVELRDIREWTWNPRLVDNFTHYDPREVVAGRLADLVHGSGPEGSRIAAATAQLLALPRYLTQRRRAFGAVSRVHLDQAVKDNAGRIRFFETELAELTGKDAAAEKARAAAIEALRAYQTFLEKELPARATRDWRLGPELYRKKFPHALQTDLAPEEVRRRAEEAFRGARARLYEAARGLHRKLFAGETAPPADAPPEVQAKVIARVRDEISKDHPAPGALVSASAAKLDGLRALVKERKLIDLPPADTLQVLPMPEFKRGGVGAEYLAPGMLDRDVTWKGTYYVDPVDPSWTPEKVESYLRANNDYDVTLIAAHEAIPGHHTQAWWARRDLSALRATLWSGSFAEGWAVYATNLLVREGLGGERNDRYAFLDLRNRMIVAANAVLDVALQGGSMTDEEALRFMVDEGFQEKALAERKLLRAKLDSTQLPQYFLGTTEIESLEREARARGSFDQRRFDEELVGHGTIAVKHLRPLVLAAEAARG